MSRENTLIILLISSMLLLAGCGRGESSQAGLQKYVDSVMRRPPPPVSPIPKFAQYKPYQYVPGKERDPFLPPKVTVQTSGEQPDMNRPKEELESFPLDGLKMVGTLEQGRKKWALILAPNQVVYRVTNGSHLGQNYGAVTDISNAKVDIEETVSDGLGGWKKRDISLSLEGSNNNEKVSEKSESKQ